MFLHFASSNCCVYALCKAECHIKCLVSSLSFQSPLLFTDEEHLYIDVLNNEKMKWLDF